MSQFYELVLVLFYATFELIATISQLIILF